MPNAGKDEFTPDASDARATPNTPNSISRCKCFLLTSGIITLLASGLSIAYIVAAFAINIAAPHRHLYYKGPLNEKGSSAQVVHPLIGPEQSFDIAVTVWLRTANDVGDGKASIWRPKAKLPPVTPLYSDIIFRGLRLTDKNVFSTVNFTLPTAWFQKQLLTNYDVRGSVVLIPTSPSLSDHIVDFSTWIPDYIDAPPARSWPFPLGSPDRGKKTMADKAVESFSVTVPLIQFHPVRSRCNDSETEEAYGGMDGEDVDSMEPKTSLETTHKKSVLSHHPYIVTRTQIRVIDETTPLDRLAYQDKLHHTRQTSCAQRNVFRPSIFRCDRSYRGVGHVETQMELAIPNESTGEVEEAYAYSPYVSVSTSAVGPKDLIPIPVTREECHPTDDVSLVTENDQDSINVSWKLSFSGRTYTKLILAEIMENVHSFSMLSSGLGESEHHQTRVQDDVELIHGIVGIKHNENAHPRRRFLLKFLQVTLACIIVVIDALYWFTRTSIVSVSILGTLLLAGSKAVEAVAPAVAAGLLDNTTAFDWISTGFTTGLELIPALVMFKALFGVRIKWRAGSKWRRWIPSAYRVPVTHAERTSQRLDAQTSYWVKGGILTSIFAVYYFLTPTSYNVLQPIIPEPLPGDYDVSWLNDTFPFFVHPMDAAGKLFQILFNWQSQTFAGGYKVSALLIVALRFIGFMDYVPMLVGRYDARRALVAHAFVDFFLLLLAAWQAVTLPRVEQDAESIHDE